MNLEKTKQKVRDLGIILSEQGLFINMPRIFSVPPDEYGIVLRVESRVPATFPILSLDTRREIERNLNETLTGYSTEVRALSKLTRVGTKFQQKTVLGRDVYVRFRYFVGSNSEGWMLRVFWVDEAVILEESRRLTICAGAGKVRANCGPVPINYVITTINDAKTPIYRTNVIKNFKIYDQVRINAHRHKIYKQKQNESASSIAKAIATGRIFRKRDITYKGLQLFGVGIPFPLDKTCSFHLIFTESRSE